MATRFTSTIVGTLVLAAAGVVVAGTAAAQAAPASAAKSGEAAAPAAKPGPATVPAIIPLSEIAWLEGCWRGSVNKRDFREQWMPMKGELMLGVSQTVMADKTVGYEYLRFEPRADGVYYVISPSDEKAQEYRLLSKTLASTGDHDDEIYTFENPVQAFPQRIVYHRGSAGWLYAQVEGKLNGVDKQIIYPMHRIDCVTDALVDK